MNEIMNLTGSLINGTICLTWDPVPDTARYEVWCKTSLFGHFSMICYGQALKFIHYTAKPGGRASYYVRAVDAYCRELAVSSRVSLRSGLAIPRVSGSNAQSGKPLLKWTPVAGAKKYRVSCTEENGQAPRLLAKTVLPSFEDVQCEPGASRSYSVTAVGTWGRQSLPSGSITVSGLHPAPVFRTAISKTGFPFLSWENPEEGCICHAFRAENRSDQPTEIAARTGTDSYINTSAALGQTYFYTIRMEYSDGIWSAPAKLREVRRPDYPDDLLEPELTRTKRGKLLLTWNPIEDAAKYQILASAKYSADKYEIQFETEKPSYLNSAYHFDEVKYYRVRAVHNDGLMGKMSKIIKVDPEQFQN